MRNGASVAGKASVLAPANIAFVKYWGARDLAGTVPANPSISMTLSRALSHSTVEAFEAGREKGSDEVWLAGADGSLNVAPRDFAARVQGHLEALRQRLGTEARFKVATRNNFPSAAGLASSASGFAALALAVSRALGLELSIAELSILARLSGSGSAARSVIGGYVEWPAGEGPERNHAVALAPADHWDLRDVIALVETGAKEVSSLAGHARAASSPYFERRQELLPQRLVAVRQALADRDFGRLGAVIEEEAIDLHLIAMSSRPAIFYWHPATLAVLERVRQLRQEGVPAYSTMDAGANVHVICLPDAEERVARELRTIPGVVDLVADGVGPGPVLTAPDLF